MKLGPLFTIGMLVGALAPNASFAQTADTLCGLDQATLSHRVAPEIEGFWGVTNGAGVLEMQGRTIPLPAGNADNALIELTSDGLNISGGSFGVEATPLNFVTDQAWTLDASGDLIDDATKDTLFGDYSVAVLSDVALKVLAGCKENAIPQLYATGHIDDAEGRVDYELFLFVISKNNMYGVVKGQLTTRGATAKRVTLFSR